MFLSFISKILFRRENGELRLVIKNDEKKPFLIKDSMWNYPPSFHDSYDWKIETEHYHPKDKELGCGEEVTILMTKLEETWCNSSLDHYDGQDYCASCHLGLMNEQRIQKRMKKFKSKWNKNFCIVDGAGKKTCLDLE